MELLLEMTTRNKLTKNNPIIGWFQYTKRFQTLPRHRLALPQSNPYVGTFNHIKKNISAEEYEYSVPLDFLLLYFKTFTQPTSIKRSVGCQTDFDDSAFIVLQFPGKN